MIRASRPCAVVYLAGRRARLGRVEVGVVLDGRKRFIDHLM